MPPNVARDVPTPDLNATTSCDAEAAGDGIGCAALSLDRVYGSVRPLTQPEDFDRLREIAIEDHIEGQFGTQSG